MDLEIKKDITSNWFKMLQEAIWHTITNLERKDADIKTTVWNRSKKRDEGGGEFRILENGKIFDKVGVNFSKVHGKFPKQFQKNILGAKKNPSFWASGISVVMHMKNPMIPAMHFNTRYICTTQDWFGGGMDVTPSIKDDKEKKEFHKTLKKMCDQHNKKYYTKYKKWCDEYFYLPHRKEPRGIGGIFFDYKKDNFEKDFKFVRDVGITFQFIFEKIIRKKMKKKWNKKHKELQFIKRDSLFAAGQIIGTEGYAAAAAGGLLAGINASLLAKGKKLVTFPGESMIGALINFISNKNQI